MSKVVILGDIGGHADVFMHLLKEHGVDVDSGLVPYDTTIIQVGDLVHKGPQSNECVEIADNLLRHNGFKDKGRYIQLIGNHDAHYLGGVDVSSRTGFTELSSVSLQLLKNLFSDGLLSLATSFFDGQDHILVTHAGLPHGLWHTLGRPSNAISAAFLINEMLSDPLVAFKPGWLMTGVYSDSAGVTCNRTGAELAVSWLKEPEMPFSQVHGHEQVWSFPHDNWHADCPEEVKDISFVDSFNRRCTVIYTDGKYLFGIDQTLGMVVECIPSAVVYEVDHH